MRDICLVIQFCIINFIFCFFIKYLIKIRIHEINYFPIFNDIIKIIKIKKAASNLDN